MISANRVREPIAEELELREVIEPRLQSRAILRAPFSVLGRKARRLACADAVCQRFMTVPGVGPLSALTYMAGVGQRQHFAKSRTVGVHFGLTPPRYESGEVAYDGRVHMSQVGFSHWNYSNSQLQSGPYHFGQAGPAPRGNTTAA